MFGISEITAILLATIALFRWQKKRRKAFWENQLFRYATGDPVAMNSATRFELDFRVQNKQNGQHMEYKLRRIGYSSICAKPETDYILFFNSDSEMVIKLPGAISESNARFVHDDDFFTITVDWSA